MSFEDGKGAVQSIWNKQRLNTKSSTWVDDISLMILWTKLFMEEQDYDTERNILYQDNKSSIILLATWREWQEELW